MKETTGTVSAETKRRQKLSHEYGSYENYEAKVALRRAYLTAESKFKELTKNPDENRRINAAPDEIKENGCNHDTIREVLDHRVPYWMDPFVLRELPLALLGYPEGSKEWEAARQEVGLDVHTDFFVYSYSASNTYPSKLIYRDYSALGWPVSAGTPIRKVTKYEDAEIMQRLRSAGLTKPGAEVSTVGKTLAEMIEENRPQPGWIINDVLRWGGAAMVYGPSGIGKTWFTHTLMLLAAAGNGAGVYNEQTGRWTLKAEDHRGARVCLLDGEMTAADIPYRAKILCDGLGLRRAGTNRGEGAVETEGASVDLSRVVIFPKADQDHRVDFVDLADPDWKHSVIEYCKAQKIDVLILDNLATLSASLEDENSAANWNPLNALIVALKKEGVATILVHHSNKGNNGYRGSSNLATTLETIVKLEPTSSARASDGAAFKIKFEKNRANGQPEADGKTLKLKDGRWVSEVDPLDQTLTVVAMAKSLKYKTQKEIGVELGVDQATVSRIIKAAEVQEHAAKGEIAGYLKRAKQLAIDLAEPVSPEELEEQEGGEYPF